MFWTRALQNEVRGGVQSRGAKVNEGQKGREVVSVVPYGLWVVSIRVVGRFGRVWWVWCLEDCEHCLISTDLERWGAFLHWLAFNCCTNFDVEIESLMF